MEANNIGEYDHNINILNKRIAEKKSPEKKIPRRTTPEKNPQITILLKTSFTIIF